jgi:cell fate (sporulation/competence/biofilm development) regulator YlbF (YheA/YmcA/DUF963 family)
MKTYEDFVQELQRGTITLSEIFVRYTEDEYEEWLLKENLKDNNESASLYLDFLEKKEFMQKKKKKVNMPDED